MLSQIAIIFLILQKVRHLIYELFLNDPHLAWGFQTYLTKMYHHLDPHNGYTLLLQMAEKKFKNNYGMIISETQTNGRGQYGNKWISLNGNLFMSLFFEIENY